MKKIKLKKRVKIRKGERNNLVKFAWLFIINSPLTFKEKIGWQIR